MIVDTCDEYGAINNIFGKSNIKSTEKLTKNIYYKRYKNISNKNNYIYLEKIIDENKKEYDYIFFDINYKEDSDFYRDVVNICDEILFIVEPNLIELQKAECILEIYKYDFGISNKKIKIIFNKSNEYKISSEVLEDVFSGYEILEYIKYNKEYNLYINKNTKYLIEEDVYEKIYIKIFE